MTLCTNIIVAKCTFYSDKSWHTCCSLRLSSACITDCSGFGLWNGEYGYWKCLGRRREGGTFQFLCVFFEDCLWLSVCVLTFHIEIGNLNKLCVHRVSKILWISQMITSNEFKNISQMLLTCHCRFVGCTVYFNLSNAFLQHNGEWKWYLSFLNAKLRILENCFILYGMMTKIVLDTLLMQ